MSSGYFRIEYTIIAATSSRELIEEVTKAMDQQPIPWKLAGGVSVTYTGEEDHMRTFLFSQALTRDIPI